jgi:S1-C subfamily serine protease
MDHEPGADAPGPDPESADTSEAPPRVPPFIAPPAAWGEPAAPAAPTSTPTSTPATPSEPSPPASEPPSWTSSSTEGTYPTYVNESTDSLPPVEPVMPAPASNEPPPPSWAWSTEARQPAAVGATAATGAATGGPGTPSRSGGMRSAVVGGIAGALVGALIAGGLLVAFDDDPQPQPVRTQSAVSDSSARPANVIVKPGDIRSILDAARPAVVRIDVSGANGVEATGTGFIVDAGGVIVTNAHVVEGQDQVMVHLADGSALTGDVVGADTRLDLAVVKVDKTGLPTLELGDSDQLQVGDSVVAIGNALGLSEGSGATVTTGIISGLDRVVDVGDETLFNAIQTDAAINPGNSGGPLVDANGKVIGINTAIASPQTSNNVGFAISISSAKPIIEALRDGKQPQIAFLGVTSQPLTADSSSELGVDQGAVVADVASDSAAAKAGIKQGDVIVEIDGAKVDSVDDVASAVRKHAPGDQIDVVIVRDGQQQTVTVTLGERPEDS